ncbi:glycosyltransferase [Accumulibacter sp.]|uniref:glycosyltransferase n=1 Tax=Accumulibacter sp. TaxID=2053492 RepID=UPI0025EB8876|nr:glycosyltransferase [Accumulibacter sp.]MCM8611626.1 glycosyltransferase [Accumulibacter sp.]MCM8635391.1 glycosyltransferase [Accumulibacter sp.]MCM8638996.1 glycosyltransferase [Accumulibacter sp.]
MRILAIYPGLNPVFDEVAFALPPLLAQGCEVRVIATRLSRLKSDQPCDNHELFRGVEIYRPYADPEELSANPGRLHTEVIRLADEFCPDFLFANSFRSLAAVRMIGRRHPVPALLRVESIDPLSSMRRRYYLGVPTIGRIVGSLRWWQAAGEVDALMTNDPADGQQLDRFRPRGRRLYYAGHCAQQPEDWRMAPARDRGEMIYIGSLVPHKNCARWLETVPAILERTPVERFTVIGRGSDERVVESLRRRYGDRVQHILGVTRCQALERLSGAFLAYSESTSGWGFLCDAWSTGTPVLCPQSTFGIVPDVNGMMPKGREELVATVARLYEDDGYYRGLQAGGMRRFNSEHTSKVVSRQYLEIFRDVAEGRARDARPAVAK